MGKHLLSKSFTIIEVGAGVVVCQELDKVQKILKMALL